MCVKFHGHWIILASTFFTKCRADQNLTLDGALTWIVGFGSNWVWWSHLGVGSCTKSFKENGIPWLALPLQCPLAASTRWEFIVEVWLGK